MEEISYGLLHFTRKKRGNQYGQEIRLTKKIEEEMAQEILKEVQQLEDVKSASFSEDLSQLAIGTEDNEYGAVMNRTVNICRRIGGGCDLSFTDLWLKSNPEGPAVRDLPFLIAKCYSMSYTDNKRESSASRKYRQGGRDSHGCRSSV